MKRREPRQGAPKSMWLLTFNDLLTLVLTFFVLVLALSRMDAAQMREASHSMRMALTAAPGVERFFAPFIVGLIRDREIAAERDKRRNVGEEALMQAARKIEGSEVRAADGGMIVVIADDGFFHRGQKDMAEGAQAQLAPLCEALRKTSGSIRVETYAAEGTGSWDLSIGRAMSVVHYLTKVGGIAPGRLSAIGYADATPPGNDGSASRAKRKERIEVVVALPER
jgi:chemotaxis protein MotB